ncbi:MAG: DUF1127 domain-containing protein [Rhodobacteraceae bacterium]|nr:DUF1127 domain-containing protein [Paracoccaceae bacterium]
MAATTTDLHTGDRAAPLAVLAAPFKALLNVLVHLAEASPRMRAIQKYQAMSDAELAARGLTRDEIVHHVFGDKFYL